MNRSIQVEGAFGVLKEDHSFHRFVMRGKKNVRTEFLWVLVLTLISCIIKYKKTDVAVHCIK